MDAVRDTLSCLLTFCHLLARVVLPRYAGMHVQQAAYFEANFVPTLQYADSRTAYDELPDATKKQIEGLVANHSLFHSRKTVMPEYFKDTDPSKLPLSKHKLSQTHEWSGRKV